MSCPVVTACKGKVKGSVVELKCKDSKSVCVYRNIPFGKPPLGELRFLAPKPADPWEGVRDGTLLSKQPMQTFNLEKIMGKFLPLKKPDGFEYVGHEDCLYLTVYTPTVAEGRKLPVMVWIYGGAFEFGSDLMYDGSALAGLHDVIVVIPNYRVGVFGFLSMGPGSACPGNAGLLDQRLALEWVRDNIGAFGGDKDNVTIFGESAGAISVHFHVISPMSSGLFHKAISHSGQAHMPGLSNDEEKSKTATKALVDKLGIKETSEVDILRGLQNASPADLLKAAADILIQKQAVFRPTVDGAFLCKNPIDYLNDNDFANHVPYIIGCNNTEGQGVVGIDTSPDFLSGATEQGIRMNPFVQLNDEAFEACKKFYVRDETDEKRYSKLLGSIYGASMFVAPAMRTASQYSDSGVPVYVYLGAFRLRMFHEEEYGRDVGKKPDWCVCDHADDISIMLGCPFTPGEMPYGAKFSEDEKKLSRHCMAYITNFAKHGDPNKGASVPAIWPKYEAGGDHLILDHPIRIGNEFSADELKMWNETIPQMK